MVLFSTCGGPVAHHGLEFYILAWAFSTFERDRMHHAINLNSKIVLINLNSRENCFLKLSSQPSKQKVTFYTF